MENVAHSAMIGGILPIFLFIIFLGVLALWIKTIVEISTSEFADNSKTTWLLVVILVGWIGMIIYYAAGRSQRVTKKDDYLDILEDDIE